MVSTKFMIWYMKPEFFREGIMGTKTPMLKATHIYLGFLELQGEQAQLERVFEFMQGEIWSPNGEASTMIAGKGLAHTSMSVGDVVMVGDKGWVVAGTGFEELNDGVLNSTVSIEHLQPQHQIRIP